MLRLTEPAVLTWLPIALTVAPSVYLAIAFALPQRPGPGFYFYLCVPVLFAAMPLLWRWLTPVSTVLLGGYALLSAGWLYFPATFFLALSSLKMIERRS